MPPPAQRRGRFFAYSGHFLLLDLVVDDVSPGQLGLDLAGGYAQLRHQHQGVVGQIRKLVNSLALVPGVGGDDDLGALLADLLEYLVQPLFKEIAGVAALGLGGLAV